MSYCTEPKCPLLSVPGIRTRGMDPWGSANPSLYFIGEAPGENEDAEGQPFCGASGGLLHGCLKEIGADYNFVRINNTVRCAPRKDDGRIGKPTKDTKGCCFPSVIEDILRTGPRVIVPMGNHATQALLQVRVGITSLRGNVRSVNLGGRNFAVLPTFHPAAIQHAEMDKTMLMFFMKDLSTAWNMAKSDQPLTGPVAQSDQDYRLLGTLQEIQEYVAFLVEHCRQPGTFVTADIESGSLDWFRPEVPLLLLSICHSPGHARAIPFDHYESPLRGKTQEIASLLKPLETLPLANQNIPFDYQWLKSRLGITLRNIVGDPLHAHHCLYTGSRPNDLETMAGLYLGEPPWAYVVDEIVAQRRASTLSKLREAKSLAKKKWSKKKETEEQYRARVFQAEQAVAYWQAWHDAAKLGKGYAVVPLRELVTYGCKDADNTWKLVPFLHEELRKQGLFEVYREHYIESIPTFAEMQYNGISVDRQQVNGLKDRLPREAEEITQSVQQSRHGKALLQAIGKPSLNLNSPPQTASLLYDIMKLPLCRIKGKKERTTDANQLKILSGLTQRGQRKGAHKVVESISKYRTLLKNLSSYVRGLENCLDAQGLVHPTWSIPGTETGRASCQEPPIHSTPKEGGYREQIVSRWAEIGGCVLGADESQNELRTYASVSNDPYLVKFYNEATSGDIHRYLASLLFQKEMGAVTDKERSIAKTCVFASLFGGGPKQLAFQTGIAFRDAERAHARFMNLLSVDLLKSFAVEQVRRSGFVRTVMGRHRIINLNAPGGHGERQSLNTLVQGPASDIVKKAADRAHRYMQEAGVRSKLIIFHHDALYWDVYPGELFWLVQLAERTMVTEPMQMYQWLRVPLKVDVGFGKSWGDKIEVDTWAENRLIIHCKGGKEEASILPRYRQEVEEQFRGPLGISLKLTNVLVSDQEVVSVVTPR